jgi:hypothetical protein
MEKDNVEKFIDAYEKLCKQHNLYIDVTAVNTLGIFPVDNLSWDIFEEILQDWRNENGIS